MSADGVKLSNSLQFDSAELAAGSARTGAACTRCSKPIQNFYYEAGGKIFCSSCIRVIEGLLDSRFEGARFARAALFGFGGAVAGAAVYFGILAATGYEVGLIAILVGFLVGWTVRRGAGRGGRSYQVLAVALTYLAIAATYMSYALKESFGEKPSHAAVADSSRSSRAASIAAPAVDSADAVSVRPIEAKPVSAGGLLVALAGLLGLTVAMPVLFIAGGLPSSLISALIMFFGLRQAWAMNRVPAVAVSGPLRLATPAPTPAPAPET